MRRTREALRFRTDGRNAVLISSPVPRAEPRGLTESEREVALMALRGRSNREIAHARDTSERTVANQLRSTYRKLGIRSRSELAATLPVETWEPRRPSGSPEEGSRRGA